MTTSQLTLSTASDRPLIAADAPSERIVEWTITAPDLPAGSDRPHRILRWSSTGAAPWPGSTGGLRRWQPVKWAGGWTVAPEEA